MRCPTVALPARMSSEHRCPSGCCAIQHVPLWRALCHHCTARLSAALAARLDGAWNAGAPTADLGAVLTVAITVIQRQYAAERILQ